MIYFPKLMDQLASERGAYYHHCGDGVPYGPSLPGESLSDYRERVKGAYGSLHGVKFGQREDFHPIHWT